MDKAFEDARGDPKSRETAERLPRLDGLGMPTREGSESSSAKVEATTFRLCSEFVNTEGRGSKPLFGFNGLGELVYQRTYARYLGEDSDDREEW